MTVVSGQDGVLRLRADGVDGAFQVKELVEESKESRAGDLLRRIMFVPGHLQPEMSLRFVMEFAAS